jgi:hypothetical protein
VKSRPAQSPSRVRRNRQSPRRHPAARMRQLSERRRICVIINAEGSKIFRAIVVSVGLQLDALDFLAQGRVFSLVSMSPSQSALLFLRASFRWTVIARNDAAFRGWDKSASARLSENSAQPASRA